MFPNSRFYDILDYFPFQDLSLLEQQVHLIEKSVYTKSEDPSITNMTIERILNDYNGNRIDFLCQPIILDGQRYDLNRDFLSEVFINTREAFLSKDLILLQKLKYECRAALDVFLTPEDRNAFCKQKHDSAAKQYIDNLSKDLFNELHSHRDEGEEALLRILENYMQYCSTDLSHYLFGINNVHSFYINRTYYSFIQLNDILDFCNTYMDVDPESKKKKAHQSVAKVIAILNEIGFFDLPYITNLSNDEARYKVIGMLLREDYNNDNLIREIRGNVYSLNQYKSVNRDRFKASVHTESVKNALNELK